MAQVEGNKEGRQVNVELNIVPFIDLMSVLITFLLITAVWTQVSMIQIGSSIYGQATGERTEPPKDANIVFRLDVKANGYRVFIAGKTYFIKKVNNEYDEEGLVKYLLEIKKTYPTKDDAIVTVDDNLPYKTLIQGMDSLLYAGFNQIAVATAGSAD